MPSCANPLRRVAGWRAKIVPIIEEQDARDPFDIHVCGDCILTRLAQLSVAGGDAPLAICAPAEPLAITGSTLAATVPAAGQSATEQLRAPPVEIRVALADQEQWRISRCAPALQENMLLSSIGRPY